MSYLSDCGKVNPPHRRIEQRSYTLPAALCIYSILVYNFEIISIHECWYKHICKSLVLQMLALFDNSLFVLNLLWAHAEAETLLIKKYPETEKSECFPVQAVRHHRLNLSKWVEMECVFMVCRRLMPCDFHSISAAYEGNGRKRVV